jgi:hypothetical protein
MPRWQIARQTLGQPAGGIIVEPADAFRRYTAQSSRRRTPSPLPNRLRVPSSKPIAEGRVAPTSVVAKSEEKAASSGSTATTSEHAIEASARATLAATTAKAASASPKNARPVEDNPTSAPAAITGVRSAPDSSPSVPSKIAFGLKIDKSKLLLGLERRIRDKSHLRCVAELPCLVCNRQPSHAHHLRFAQRRGLSQKVSDEFVVPLCALHHSDLHRSFSEQGWWKKQKIDPLAIAHDLWANGHPQ